MANKFRRIVTGHNAQGKSIFVSDGQSPATFNRAGDTTISDYWVTDVHAGLQCGQRGRRAEERSSCTRRTAARCSAGHRPAARLGALRRQSGRGAARPRGRRPPSRVPQDRHDRLRHRARRRGLGHDGRGRGQADEGRRRAGAARHLACLVEPLRASTCVIAFILIDAKPAP